MASTTENLKAAYIDPVESDMTIVTDTAIVMLFLS